MIDGLLRTLGAWSRLAQTAPWRWGLLAMALGLVACWLVARAIRARLEQLSDRVAAGPIFAIAGLSVLALALVWWLVDAILFAAGQLLLEERLLLLLAPAGDGAAFLRQLMQLTVDQRLMPPAPVLLPLVLFACAALYLTIVLWMGRTLAEMTSLEQKPEDVLAKERAAQRKAIAQALKEGRPIPAAEVVSVPLADDRLGRTFKLLGHWTSVELVEERFVRWQRPLVAALTLTLVFALPAALGGHLGAPLWVGAAIALDGLRRNLKTRPAAPEQPAAEPAAEPPPAPTVPSLSPLLEAIHRETGVLAALPVPSDPQGAQISPGTELEAKRVLEDLFRELALPDGLYVHQGLACDAFAARRNVLVTTPPLSGRQVLVDVLVFYTLLVDGENVLYLAPSAPAAKLAEERFRERAEAARWRWNIHAANIAGRAGAVDLARTQPGLVFTDPESLHLEICGKQREWSTTLAGLGLVVAPDLDRYDGARGAHLAHLLRRLRRAVEHAAPKSRAGAAADRVRFVATAAPLYRDLGRFAERLVGRPFQVLGPEVDGAPRPARGSFVLAPASKDRAKATPSDLHPAVHSLGEALAQGFSAELFGFEDVLASDDVARANEVMIARGVATRGRALSIGAERWGATGEALAEAEVVIARASSTFFSALPLLTAHLGLRAGPVPPPRVASLGAGEHVGRGAAPPPPKKPEPPPDAATEAGEAEEGAEAEPAPEAPAAKNAVLVLWQPDLDPFALLLARERPLSNHPDMKHGCVLAIDPLAEAVQRDHLRATLAEGEAPVEELERDFSKSVLSAELAELEKASSATASTGALRLVERTRREIDAAGTARDVRVVSIGGGADVHGAIALATAGPAARVVDRHTGELLFHVERERALSAAYPGRVFVHAGRRFAVLPIEQQDRTGEHVIVCEREERPLSTSKIRRVALNLDERRAMSDRREAPRSPTAAPAPDRRAQTARTLGGVGFTLEHRRVSLSEEVIGLRRYGPDGRERDATAYADPIGCRYDVRAALLGLPRATFADVGDDALHALAHLFRVTLPAFVRHADDDLDVAWIPKLGDDGGPALAFIDAHPGGVGFADAVTLDSLRSVVRWSLALTRRCPGGCTSPTGCPRCLQIERCRAEPARQHALDKRGADRVLALLVGPETAATFGREPVG